ncbi:MAG: site-specific DNA-methyltransferase, partial [Proteobacteria bacterium]|nr:site-specific DNA-methyltransferase [Pseudomonadota bacterium]
MTPLNATSLDLTKDNLEQLKSLFPNVFSEGKIDFDALKAELGEHLELEGERYQFSWNGKAQAKRIATTPSMGTLRPAVDESVNWDTTENLYIEGDNLEVLKLLQKAYFGKVKMIYIDPPYNTGKDFVYKDDFKDNLSNYKRLTNQVDEQGNPLTTNSDSSGRYHSNWLNMMYPRLKLARNLLRDDGVIFISIDDNEVHNLRKLCDEIFGEGNFVANVIWEKKYTRANDAQWFSDNHDHILCYGKLKDVLVLNNLPRSEEQLSAYKNPDAHRKGVWKATPLHAKSGTNIKSYTFKNGVVWEPPVGTYRRFNDETMKKMDDGDEIWFGLDGSQTPSRKSFLSEIKDGVTPVTLWSYDEVGHNHEATNDLKELLLGGLFTNPKPIRLIKRALTLATVNSTDDIILDFFSGSATTAHAVMQLNAEDGGKRKFILVQIPEATPEGSEARKSGYATIAEIGKERIRRAGKKIKEDKPDTLADLGFKVFKLDTSNIKAWNPTPETLQDDLLNAVDNILVGRTDEDLLYEVLIKYGLPMTLPVEKIQLGQQIGFSVDMGSLITCF